MSKQKASEALSAVIEGNVKRQGEKVLSLDDFRKFGVRTNGESTYEINTILHFPETIVAGMLDVEEFTIGTRVIKSPVIWVDASLNGVAIGPKKVFISQLIKIHPVYKEENGMYVRDENKLLHSDTKLFEELSKYKDMGAVLEAVLGSDIIVTHYKEDKIASYTNGVVTGIQTGKVNCFERVEE